MPMRSLAVLLFVGTVAMPSLYHHGGHLDQTRGHLSVNDGVKDGLDECPIGFDEILQAFDVEIPKPKEQVEQEQDVDRINE